MYVPRLSLIFVSTFACLTGAVQAQGPWPTTSQPSFFSPVQEFFTPRPYTTNYFGQPQYNQYPSTPIIPGVPQCANGRCRQNCPNGQCSPSNQCANGQCSRPVQSFFQPLMNPMGTCANGSCRQNSGCANGQCGNQTGFFSGFGNNSTARSPMPNSSLGFRPLSQIQPTNNPPSRGGQLNRLIPLDGGFSANNGLVAPQRPQPRRRESMLPPSENFALDPMVRLQ